MSKGALLIAYINIIISCALVLAIPTRKVVVFGASGRTGQAIVKELMGITPPPQIICAVRDTSKARRIFGPESSTLSIVPCDVSLDSERRKMGQIMKISQGAQSSSSSSHVDAVIIATGYSPSSSSEANAFLGSYNVDNLGTKRIVDAAVKSKVPKVVLISSLLTNGLASGQFLNPQV